MQATADMGRVRTGLREGRVDSNSPARRPSRRVWICREGSVQPGPIHVEVAGDLGFGYAGRDLCSRLGQLIGRQCPRSAAVLARGLGQGDPFGLPQRTLNPG